MKKVFLAIVLLLCLVACSASTPDQSTAIKGVILDEAGANSLRYYGFPGKHWLPDQAQIAALETALPAYLKEQAPQLGDPWENHTGQYAGVTDSDGRQLIYANFFCGEPTWVDWQTQLVSVLDGGDCYFQTVYDPAAGTFLWLAINGES